jgi:hypothetical protein
MPPRLRAVRVLYVAFCAFLLLVLTVMAAE